MKVLVGDGCGNRFALIDAGAMSASDLSPGLVLHQCRDMDIDGLLVLDGVKLSIYNADGKKPGKEFITKEYLESTYRACHEAQMEAKTEERERIRGFLAELIISCHVSLGLSWRISLALGLSLQLDGLVLGLGDQLHCRLKRLRRPHAQALCERHCLHDGLCRRGGAAGASCRICVRAHGPEGPVAPDADGRRRRALHLLPARLGPR